MKITSQDPLVYFAAEAKSLGGKLSDYFARRREASFLGLLLCPVWSFSSDGLRCQRPSGGNLLPEGDPLLITKGTPMDVVLSFLKLTGYTRVDFAMTAFSGRSEVLYLTFTLTSSIGWILTRKTELKASA